MKSISSVGLMPAGQMLVADDFVEFHACRLLLLLTGCGVRKRDTGDVVLSGMTKMAKLDFFVRYPAFFARAVSHLGLEVDVEPSAAVESRMIRFHYGPWDKRYNQVLPYLQARGLAVVEPSGR